MVQECFPWPVGVGVRRLDDGRMLDDFPEEQEALGPRAVLRRRQQFTLGRSAAHQALSALGASPSPVLRGARGEPLWPAGITGAITHTGATAVAVVGWRERYQGIGVDLEPLRPGLTDEASHLVCTEREAVWVAGDPVRLTMLFCAKEAAFKALYPIARVVLDFQDAQVTWTPETVSFDVLLLRPAGTALGVGFVLHAPCRLVDEANGMVLATAYIPVTPG